MIVRNVVEDPVTYVWNWLRSTEPDRLGAELDRWCEYYAAIGVQSVVAGTVILRRRGAASWERHVVSNACPAARTGGVQIERMFAAASNPLGLDDDVLASRFRLVSADRLQQILRYDDTHYEAQPPDLILDASGGFAVTVPPAVLLIVLQLDGSTPLHDLVAEMAAENHADAAQLGRAASDAIRNLYDFGFAVPA